MPEIAQKLENDRRDLLDLSMRNTLLNFRVLKSKGLQIVEELPKEVYRILVEAGREMSFLPAPDDDPGTTNGHLNGDELTLFEFDQPNGNGDNEAAARHTDNKLQTSHKSKSLQNRLLNSFYAARTSIEEHGVNTLFLALGMLEWFEAEQAEDPRRAPLILIPVELHRDDVKTRFKVSHNGDDVGINLSLQQKLKHDFRIELPIPDSEDELDVESFFDGVESVTTNLPGWTVDRDSIQLGFFSFTKLLMYEDLNPKHWIGEGDDVEHDVMSRLLGEGFHESEPVIALDSKLDEFVKGIETYPIWDADSSQTIAIQEVLGGRNLIVQGPPGTGKSQTITNLIADCIAQNRKVLFVAEKMAALEVVKRRLTNARLGDACLELHSHKTNRRAVLEELRSTWELGEPRLNGPANGTTLLQDAKDRLNRYCEDLHAPIGDTGVTPYQAYGVLVGLLRDLQGVDLPNIDLDSPVTWTREQFNRRLGLAEEMQALINEIGTPQDQPFWGSGVTVVTPTLREKLAERIRSAQESLVAFQRAVQKASVLIGVSEPQSLNQATRLLLAAERALEAPPLKSVAVGDSSWHEREDEIASSIDLGKRICRLRKKHETRILPESWSEEVLSARKSIAVYGQRWWRILSKDYREATKAVSGLVKGERPKTQDERLVLLDAILEAQRHTKRLDQSRDLVKALLGPLWRDHESQWGQVEKVTTYLARLHQDIAADLIPAELINYLSGNPTQDDLKFAVKDLNLSKDGFERALEGLVGALNLDETVVWPEGAPEAEFDRLNSMFARWHDSAPRIAEIVRLNDLLQRVSSEGLDSLNRVAVSWPSAGRALANLLKKRWYEALIENALNDRRSLAVFSGRTHEETIKRFQELDTTIITNNRTVVANAHWNGLPEPAGIGSTGVLRREFEKRRRHLPIRRLMEQAGPAVQAIKPVFMMSPLSVAAYLPPQGVSFDLVIFDEASQVTPVDAYGAILRGRQAVVVGDSKQLPPTPFFAAMRDGLDEEEVAEATSDLESILGLFASKGAPSSMLRWHYRSRHESLIAVSNHEFYDNKLVVMPSPERDRRELGLVYRYLPDSAYERGRGLARNPKEAEHVASAVMEHARSHPELSLGVAAFSRSQQQTILDHLEAARREDPTCEGFFASHSEEPFFVKNLENVQGDERDVILISVGYGRTENGYLAMNFGPLNQQGGERRLNVLITRARRRCEVFTNLSSEDIDLGATQAQGVAALKRFLKFAEVGILDVPQETGRPAGSDFELQVADRLMAAGCNVDLQVGSGGFYVDLGITDPDAPGRYLVGIECDGASYHSAAWARDRDRIRQEVLESLGWRIHRVWSTDWFQDPDRELQRALDVVKEELDKSVERRRDAANRANEAGGQKFEIERGENGRTEEVEIAGVPYTLADPEIVLRGIDIASASSAQSASWIKKIVDVESPVHFNEMAQRVLSAVGVHRLGPRIQENLWRGVRHAEERGLIERRGNFLWLPGRPDPTVRDRSSLPLTSRKIELIADEEIAQAVRQVVEASYGAEKAVVIQQVCRMLGFARTTEGMKARVDDVIRSVVAEGRLSANAGQLSFVPSSG